MHIRQLMENRNLFWIIMINWTLRLFLLSIHDSVYNFNCQLKLINSNNMKLFEITQENLNTFGINPRYKNKFNLRSLGMFLLFSVTLISVTAFIIFDANSFREYQEPFFEFTVAMNTALLFVSIISKSTHIFPIIKRLEKTIEMRKSESILYYNILNSFILSNRTSNRSHFEIYVHWSKWKDRKMD